MKIIIIDWDFFGNIEPAFVARGYNVRKCEWDIHASAAELDKQKKNLDTMINQDKPDYVFGYNFQPAVSEVCQEHETVYMSWIYDSPFFNLYDKSIVNPVNRVFVFDYAVYQKFEQGGISTVKYLPLAINKADLERRCGKLGENIVGAKGFKPSFLNLPTGRESLEADVSLVGSLYTEPKHRLYDKFAGIAPYAKGYLDAIISAQKAVYGENFLERLLNEDIIAEMEKAYPTDPNDTTNIMTPAQIYSEFVLSRQVTSLERTEILQMLGQQLKNTSYRKLRLYTHDSSVHITGWKNMGPVEYFNEMPQVFRCSRINLNITLRSILTGIPLRAFDIMGAGGFLLTNYQAEYGEYFVPGEDLVIYESYDDLMEKVEYYLSHEKERIEIAINGCRKVREEHNLDCRLDAMEREI